MSQAQFEKAVSIVQGLPKDGPVQPTQEDKLTFYKHFKQATIGNNNTTRPGMWDFVGKAKWDAWESVKDMPQEKAREAYVNKLIELLENSGDADSAKFAEELKTA